VTRSWFGLGWAFCAAVFFMLTLGFVAGAALGIWDPVQALIQLSPNAFAMIVLLVFVLVAQITTNLTINILPPALIFMDTFRMTWPQGVLLSGVLGGGSCPWVVMSDFDAVRGVLLNFLAVVGPMIGVMLADSYVIRKRQLDVAALYDTTPASPNWYRGGFNVAGDAAVLMPGLITMIWYLGISWLIGLPAGFVLYLVLFPLLERKAEPARAAGAPSC